VASMVRACCSCPWVIEKRAGGILHCSLDGSASGRWFELPKWMFDAACLSMSMAVSPRVDSTALMALKPAFPVSSGDLTTFDGNSGLEF
jgi:hypothetical protein